MTVDALEVLGGRVLDRDLAALAAVVDRHLRAEALLESILELERSAPTTDTAFDLDCLPGCSVTTCSCSYFLDLVWSFTTYYDTPVCAWTVSFDDGAVDPDYKDTPYPVRAVRTAR